MKRWAQLIAAGARVVLGAIGSVLLLALWAVLAAMIAIQLYVANANELAVPPFALRRVEAKLAESGLRATFARTSFDPTGRVLIENVRLSARQYPEPFITAHAVYIRFSPWLLMFGRLEPREIRVTGATASVPAVLSPNGRPEELIPALDATFEPQHHAIAIRQLSTQVGGVIVSARGTIPLPRTAPATRPLSAAIADFFAHRFPSICRDALTWSERIKVVENPALDLEFVPSESGAVTIQVTALATKAKLDAPIALEATQIKATTRLLLLGEAPPSHLEVSVREARLPQGVVVQGLNASVYGRIHQGNTEFDWREITVTADHVSGGGFGAQSISAQIFPRPRPRLNATIVANLYGAALGAAGHVDVKEGSAQVRFAGPISPAILDPLSAKLGVNVRKYYDFEALTAERGDVQIGPGWKFEKLTARVRVPRMNSYGVTMEDGRATVELEPTRFYSPDAFARIGENYARGSYEHDLKTHQYRFLLQGRLRPLEISEWFRDWWSNFFRTLEFPAQPPQASVDVAGFWRNPRQSSVFVFADSGRSIIRGAEFDRVRTRMFIRPGFFDGLELLATKGKGNVHGRFTLATDTASGEWRSLELGLDSSLDLKFAEQLMPPTAAQALAAFELAAPPTLKVRGSFAGPAATKKTPDTMRIEARTEGNFRYHGFPLQNVSFIATVDGDEVVLDDIEAMFGGGVTGGKARVWGKGAERRLGFDIAIKDATLGQAVGSLQAFFAAKKGEAAPPPAKFVLEKANIRLDVAASAEGLYADPLSLHGDGNAALSGGEIGEVALLGQLSELLKFTALRFTEARANFKIEGPKLIFPKVELRGSNSAIDAHGEFDVAKKALDFNAKIFPFQESENVIKSVVGAVLAPLSNAFEVKLTGSATKPEWAFVRGPTNFLRSLTPENQPPESSTDSSGAKKTAPPATSETKTSSG